MKYGRFNSPWIAWRAASSSLLMMGLLLSLGAAAAQQLEVKPVVEKKVTRLPEGPLFWRIENFPALAQAQAAAGPTALVAEAAGKVWLFTPGPKDGGPPGAKTPVHTHPGSEAFYVLTGKLGQKTPHGVSYAEAGTTMNGHGADMPMEVFSAGTSDLDQLVIFVV